ncbi:MAG: dethiobiotin synthase [Crocinitomicaceae bacterium]|nr:dethiobiotin synthase [Crocinitomicaceae bacterium]
MNTSHVVVGIGTDVGKTIVSALLVKLSGFTYWKPIQAGVYPNTDSERIGQLLKGKVQLKKELHIFNTPASPHLAASIDGVELKPSDFLLKEEFEGHIIEGAGGICVPLNNHGLTYLDVLEMWQLPVVVVSMHYLGSINHTLLTLNSLQQRNIPTKGVVFVGEENPSTESVIKLHYPRLKYHRVNKSSVINEDFLEEEVLRWKLNENW